MVNNAPTYHDFLSSKIKVASKKGVKIDPSLLHPSGKPHQNLIIQWALELGAALIGPDCGLGKTHITLEMAKVLHTMFGRKYLVVTELGAAETFVSQDPEVGEGVRLGIPCEYVTCQREAMESECFVVVTNYERVRNNEFDFAAFGGVFLDEGNYIKNIGSETTDSLAKQLVKVHYKYILTATPSPNEHLELINYAHVLGICDRGQILTRYFKRNSTKAGELTLYDLHRDEFWLWVRSWCIMITLPGDLPGCSNDGYILPELQVFWHELDFDTHISGKVNRDGQKEMFTSAATSLPDAAKVKRESIDIRVKAAINLVLGPDANPADHWLIWHHLEDERKALKTAFQAHPSYGDLYGQLDSQTREKRIVAFTKGQLQILGTKPDISGVGCNFQKYCHKNVLLGPNHDFDQFYQLYKRTLRFGQKYAVELHVFYMREEAGIIASLKEKWRLHEEMRDEMRKIIQTYGLDHSTFIEERKRTFATTRKEWKGNSYTLVNNDCVPEIASMPDNSVDMILTSIPFGNHYEYTDKYNDFGHNNSNSDFFSQFDYLAPELLRVLKPGRICAFHTKNRIYYGSVTGLGFSIFHRFTHHVCDMMERNGFYTLGFHYVPTSVVEENNQTYRLTFGEMKKDATKMGSGIPEEIWLFRKAPTSPADAYADEPVTHGDDYSLANWQLDADAFWQSSGDRYLTPDELRQWGLDKIQAWWKQFNKETIYDYEKHVELLKMLDAHKKLSRTFTTTPLQSNSEFIWNDVNRMQGLNVDQRRRKQRNHICPMPFDEVDRLIELYSNPGELILEPFGGLGTTGVRAVKKNRRAYVIELSEQYSKDAHTYLKETEMKNNLPTLLDFLTFQQKTA